MATAGPAAVVSPAGPREEDGGRVRAPFPVRLGATSSHPAVYTPAPRTREAAERPSAPLTQQEAGAPQNSACAVAAGENEFLTHNKTTSTGKVRRTLLQRETVFDTERGREPPAEKRDPGPRRPSSVTPWKTGPSARPGFPRGKAGCTAPQGANAKASAMPAAEGPRRDGPSPFRASLKSPRNTWCFHQDTTPREPLAHRGAACTARLQWQRARHPHWDSRRGLRHAEGGGPPRRAP